MGKAFREYAANAEPHIKKHFLDNIEKVDKGYYDANTGGIKSE